MKLKNRLAILMAEKEIKNISTLQRMITNAGLSASRRTLDNLYNNENNTISYETIATLCQILECDLSDLLILVKKEVLVQQ